MSLLLMLAKIEILPTSSPSLSFFLSWERTSSKVRLDISFIPAKKARKSPFFTTFV
jgi:hypothetical protein